MKSELKVGIFFAVVLVMIAVIILVVGDISNLFKKPGYSLYLYFDSAVGLEKRNVVRLAGVKIGYIDDIRLKGSKAEVVLSIDSKVGIKKGSRAKLAALGLLGEKYIEIIPGKGPGIIQPGETMESISSVGFDQLGPLWFSVGDEIRELGKSLRELVGEEKTKENFKETIQNLSALVADLKDVFEANKGIMNESLQNSSKAIQNFDQRSERISRNLDELISVLKDTVEENRGDVKLSLKNIKELISRIEEAVQLLNKSLNKINRGDGTLGKMIQQPELYTKAEETVQSLQRIIRPVSSFKARAGLEFGYYGESNMVKSRLMLSLWPTSKKYLFAEIIRDPWQDIFTYSLQGGIRLGAVSTRAGIMESRMGAGIDCYVLGDRLKFSFESLDFNRHPRPRFRVWTTYAVAKYFYVLFGIDDFTLAPQRELFFGLGLGL